eukprot:jgi/Picsp_1/6265/NSC_03617-R1_protein
MKHLMSFYSNNVPVIGPTRSVRTRSCQEERPLNRTLRLPGGEYWWLDSKKNVDVIYGNHFVIERPRCGGEGLVPYSVGGKLQMTSSPLSAQEQSEALSVFGHDFLSLKNSKSKGLLGGGTVSRYLLPESSSASSNISSCSLPVLVSGNSPEIAPPPMSHPRRTARLSFTCNLCGKRMKHVPVNPHAWKNGSVFCTCEGCRVVHKLKDNLEIFHEIGDVFPPRNLRNDFLVRDILSKIKRNGQ